MAKKQITARLFQPEMLYPYSTVAKPLPPLEIEDICEGDILCVSFACAVAPYIMGALEVYRWEDSFSGSDDEKKRSVGVMRQLMENIGEAMACCGDNQSKVTDRRLNPVTGMPEVSTDGGATWQDDPQSVYKQAVVAQPLRGADGSVKKCEAANNVVENLQDLQAAYSDKVGQLINLFDLCVELLVLAIGILLTGLIPAAAVAVVVALIPKIIETARFLTGTTKEAYDALFTNQVWDTVRCILLCHISPNGSFTQQQFDAVLSDLKSQLGSGAQQAGANLASMIDVWQLVGLNNAARIGSGIEGNCDDCTDCGCSMEVTFDGLNWTDYGVQVGIQQGSKLQLVAHEYGLGAGFGCEVTIDMLTLCAVGQVSAVFNGINNRPDHAVSLICTVQDENHQTVLMVDGSGNEVAVGTDYVLGWDMQGSVGRYVNIVVAWLTNFGAPNSGTIDSVGINL